MRTALGRRTLLRGAGTVLALPLLEAMLPARGRVESPPTRSAWIYVPNGVHLADWRVPALTDADPLPQELPWILAPLRRERFSLLSGLTQDKARANGDGPGDHARAAAVFLTGVQPRKTEGQVRLGPSADQIAAAVVGGATRLRSLELGCERGKSSGQCDSGYACAYSSNVSWLSETTPAAKETSPRLVFERLFGRGPVAAERALRRRSVLDNAGAEAERLRGAVGRDDRHRLDEYFEALREIERRLDFADAQQVAVPEDARPSGTPRDYGEHARLLADVLVLAFRTDSTRIATFMLADEGSNRSYRELGASEGHHTLSHHGGDAEKQARIRAINRFHVELLAYLLDGLAAVREGGQSLLDATQLVYGSGIADGDRHDHHDLPVLLCGGGNGALHPGRHVVFPRETPLGNLHLALLANMGVACDALGDATGLLAGL
jgi:hypothetical protein